MSTKIINLYDNLTDEGRQALMACAEKLTVDELSSPDTMNTTTEEQKSTPPDPLSADTDPFSLLQDAYSLLKLIGNLYDSDCPSEIERDDVSRFLFAVQRLIGGAVTLLEKEKNDETMNPKK